MVGELNFLLGLQIKQCQDGIFISQGKYVKKKLLKKYKLDEVKHTSTPMALNMKLDLDPSGKLVSEKVYNIMMS